MPSRLALPPFALALAAAAAAGADTAAARQPFCAARSEIVETLRSRYGESRRGVGLQDATTLFEIFASDETGSWTVLLTDTAGRSCAVAAGQAWRDDAPTATSGPDA